MVLAPYGEPKYASLIYDHLMDLKADGSFRLDLSYFDYCIGLTMTSAKFHKLFGGPPRKPEQALTQREMDLAASVQAVADAVGGGGNGPARSVPCGGCRPQLRGQRQDFARRPRQASLDTAGRRGRGRRARRGARRISSFSKAAPQSVPRIGGRHERRVPRSGFRSAGNRAKTAGGRREVRGAGGRRDGRLLRR